MGGCVGAGVGVEVGLSTAVGVGVGLAVGMSVAAGAGVGVGIRVGVGTGMAAGVSAGVAVAVGSGIDMVAGTGAAAAVGGGAVVGVSAGRRVAVPVGSRVGPAVAVGSGWLSAGVGPPGCEVAVGDTTAVGAGSEQAARATRASRAMNISSFDMRGLPPSCWYPAWYFTTWLPANSTVDLPPAISSTGARSTPIAGYVPQSLNLTPGQNCRGIRTR